MVHSIDFASWNLTRTILMLKRRQDGHPNFPILCKKRETNLAITILQEPSKSLARAFQKSAQSPQKAPKSPQEAPLQPPRGLQMGGLLDVHVTAF